MNPRVGVSLLLVLIVGVPAASLAQSQDVAPNKGKTQSAAAVPKPTRNTGWIATDDPVAQLAMRRAPGEINTPAGLATKKEENAATNETGKQAAEMAAVEQQIKDKQKRITLLMRLFVNDEKTFLMDPSNTEVEAGVAERRRYEQDELRWETAELTRLKGRLEELRKNSR